MVRFAGSFALVLSLALPAREAAAHPKVVSSTPTANSRVASAPSEIAITFNEKITLALSKLTVLNAAQQPIALDSLRNSNGDATTLAARTTAKLAAGRYTVKWQAAGSDGHPMRGEFSFVIDASTAEQKPAKPAPPR